jgi:hypothetical protein
MSSIESENTKSRRKSKKASLAQTRFRKIPSPEARLLKSLWRWKVLSYMAAKKFCFNSISHWSFYQKVRRLIAEGYVIERTGVDLEVSVLQLSKKGFEYLKYDLGYLRQHRYAAQSVTHDYWVTAFQLGEFFINPSSDVEFLTEQELHCTDDSLLPEWVPKSREHFPDGFTRIKNANSDSVFAFEVDLNLKPELRYIKSGYYFDGIDCKTDVVFWLCDGVRLMERIFEFLNLAKLRRPEIFHFVLLDDFKKFGWRAVTRSGREKNKTIREIYFQRSPQGLAKELPSATQAELMEILLSKKKSPWVSKA